MLTINFEVPDLLNTRFAVSALDHVLAAPAEAHHCLGIRRSRWWRQTRRHVPAAALPLLELLNANPGNVPDFLLADASAEPRQLADELGSVLASTEADLLESLAGYEQLPNPPRIVAELRGGDNRALRRITDGAWAFFQACLAPDWPDISHRLQADIARRARTTGESGLGAALAGVHPRSHWQQEGTLHFAVAGWNHTFDLGGQGLELRPNHFVQDGIGALLGTGRPPVLLYPIAGLPTADGRPVTTADRLSGLLGTARARALRAIGQEPCSTTELARRLGITPPSACSHATALRAGGIITTERQGRQVRHILTPLGHALLGGTPNSPDAHRTSTDRG